MATILQVDRLGEAREVVCTTMDEWWTIFTDNTPYTNKIKHD